MVVIGLTGHGLSKDNFSQSPEGYVFSIAHGKSNSIFPEHYLTGRELAELISALNADEVLMFVQSCNSGSLSNVDFMNKYSAEEAYLPRSEIKNSAAARASVDILDMETLIGVDPQFFEYISPNLPLLPTHSGYGSLLELISTKEEVVTGGGIEPPT